MMHTMLLSAHVTDEEAFEDIEECLRLDTSIGRDTNRDYSRNGFREIRLVNLQKRTGGMYTGIEIRLNPKLLLNPENSIQSTTAAEVPLLTEPFDHQLRHIFGGMTRYLPRTFLDWTCKRIDYCVDVTTEHASDYIKLIQRCKKPNRHFRNNRYDGSAYMNSKSAVLNFYDKEDETGKRLNDEYTTVRADHLDEAKNILRFEVQCRGNKTSYIRRKHSFTDKRLEHFLEPQLAESIILDYFDRTIGSGDFYSLYEADKLINRAIMQERSKDALRNALRLIAQVRDVDAAREQFTHGVNVDGVFMCGSGRTFNDYINRLRMLDINPVTIPRNWKSHHLPCLRVKIMDYFRPETVETFEETLEDNKKAVIHRLDYSPSYNSFFQS